MNAIDFCYWLQGHFELSENPDSLTEDQVRVIRNHLRLTFQHHIDPLRNGQSDLSARELQTIHNGNVKADIESFFNIPSVKNPNVE